MRRAQEEAAGSRDAKPEWEVPSPRPNTSPDGDVHRFSTLPPSTFFPQRPPKENISGQYRCAVRESEAPLTMLIGPRMAELRCVKY
ncbi:hypothetical protein KM043_003051 [Ampulex compressa]|nr:hypothetical protein KM043_003051 [Ampulex compressa]